MTKTFPGLNVQFPWGELIAKGSKSVETRFYPLPERYIGKELLIVETPGPRRDIRRKPIAVVTFGKSFEYKSMKQFYADSHRHLVTAKTDFKWEKGRKKWGWPVTSVRRISGTIPSSFKTGIVFSRAVPVRISSPPAKSFSSNSDLSL